MMENEKESKEVAGNFYLNKWFLDFIGEDGSAMIFYAAKFKWHGWSAVYSSWLHYDKIAKVRLKSRLSRVQMPTQSDNIITWTDSKFGVSGTWKSLGKMLESRLFESSQGHLDWKCFQPASIVQLKINNKVFEGRGYVEQLILTVPPWKIPMDELRWGRFGSNDDNLVWIELREKHKRQWLWLNGEKIENCIIQDDRIILPGKNFILNLDQGVTLESMKKIFSVVGKLVRYVPGFNKVLPSGFLMADESKWLSKGLLQKGDETFTNGMAIHEMVNFKAN
jgi:hypothetical protein